jgi:hypothetical protein
MRAITEDNQYLDLRNCANSTLNIKRYHEIGILKNGFDCNSDILWFKEEDDLVINTYDPDEISIDRGEVESDLALKQTKAEQSSIEFKKTIEVKADYGSRFLQYVREININERTSGRNGNGVIALSNGGFWFKETIVINEGEINEYKEETIYPNLKVATWINPFSGNIKSDTVYPLEFMVEDWPVYQNYGTRPNGWAMPKDIIAPTVLFDNITLTNTNLTFTNLDLEDLNLPPVHDLSISKPIIVNLYKEDGTFLTSAEFSETNATAVITYGFTSIGKVIYSIDYAINDQMEINAIVGNITKTAII